MRKGLSCPRIAAELGVNEGTVYKWKAEAAERGESFDWEIQRRIYLLSPREMVALYAESLKTWLVKIKGNPDLLADPKVADAVAKHIAAMQRIDARGQYLGVAIDLIKVATDWLAEHQPELAARLQPYWESIYTALVEYSTRKGLF